MSKRASWMAVVVFLMITCIGSRADWYGTYGYRQMISIDHTAIGSTLTNFPVLITETNVKPILWTHARSDARDIVFTAADGVTKLSHEIEHYTNTPLEIAAWVNIPLLSSSVDTEIYMYYGKPSAGNTEDTAGAWGNNYVGVWHLSEKSGTNYDSTATSAHVTPNAAFDNQDATGQIDGANSFDGVDDYMDIVSDLTITNYPFTMSAWIRTTNNTVAYQSIAEIAEDVTTYRYVTIGTYNGKARILMSMGTGDKDAGTVYVADGAWHHVVGVFSSATNRSIYVDGIYDTVSATDQNYVPRASTKTAIGRHTTSAPGKYWNGDIDEVRISDVARSPAWIATCYTNQTSPSTFASASVEETGTIQIAEWYNNKNWLYRQSMTISYDPGLADLTNFPILITEVNVDDALWGHAQNNGGDILFTAADGMTKLSHEIEYYTNSSRKMVIWVKIPVLSASGDTDIYMYYGAPVAENQENTSVVWENSYNGVWHLSEKSGTNYDSTIGATHLAPNIGFDDQDALGQIDGANSFDGVDDYVGANSDLAITNYPFTMSAWVKTLDNATEYQAIVDIADYTKTYRHASIVTYQGKAKIFIQMGSGAKTAGTVTISDGGWHHVVGVFASATNRSIYVDGIYNAMDTSDQTYTWVGNTRTSIGRRGISTPDIYWDGNIDEVRVSDTARDAAWIAACYANQKDPATFVSHAPEEQMPVYGTMILIQ